MVIPKLNHVYLYKRQAERDWTTHRGEGDMKMELKRFKDFDLED